MENFQNAITNRKISGSEEKSSKKEKKKAAQSIDSIDLIIYVESARGLLDLKDVCAHMIEMSEFAKIRLAGIVLGSDDFCASIGQPPY